MGFIGREVGDRRFRRSDLQVLRRRPDPEDVDVVLEKTLQFFNFLRRMANSEVVGVRRLLQRTVRNEKVEEDRAKHGALRDSGLDIPPD